MQNPLITIGLTTYNAEDTVRKALDSAFSQTWQPVEVVAVDDCSHDGTWQILEEYAQKHREIRIFRNETNSGVAVSRNRILAEAKGEFIAFFDDDDVSLPERLTAQYQRIVGYEKECPPDTLIVCHTARKLFYPNGGIIYRRAIGQDRERSIPAGIKVARRMLMGEEVAKLKNSGSADTCSQMARLSVYQAVGGFDNQFRRLQDTEIAIRWGKLDGHFVGVAEALVEQEMTGTTEKSADMLYRYKRMLFNKHRAIANTARQYRFCLQLIKVKYLWLKKEAPQFLPNLLFLFFAHPIFTMLYFIRSVPNLKGYFSFRRLLQKIQ